MRDTIDMMRDACDKDKVDAWQNGFWTITQEELKAFEALVRADERDKWMERTAILIRGEREACAKVCDARYMGDNNREDMEAKRCAAAIRARGNT